MCLMVIKYDIPKVYRGTVSEEITSVKDFFAEIEKRFVKSEKAEASALLQSLTSMRYQGNRNVREYIMEMSNIASKLKALKLELQEDLLEKWSLNELISYCVQEEERLKQERTESAHLTSTSND
ncbi:uncharacterized protein LOC106780212 [Vigna radiata var. radiata]|uniref:Uncharacterized protein LOC106780212 n=1 Tax=Vigna radiata var. radiata TaxID=3916 RepID=A0A1S3W054_VIGRR|nr:uncharacterized protein LOC106780212 [Vigna radiata var. radiata]